MSDSPEPTPESVKEHPEPKVSTVKQLYGSALRCAKPECSRPLYNQDNDTGDVTLNSRIAHIHARRAGGPRWIEMTSEENRDSANLLLLCIEHSYEVDEAPDRFPAAILRQWKQEQVEEHKRAERGWSLSDADAGRVLQASSQAFEHHSAGALIGAVRAVERLTLAARRVRRGPAAKATAWRASRARARNSFTGWDVDGNALHAEPSAHETRQHTIALETALIEARDALTPLSEEAKVELAAVRVGLPSVAPWSEWCARAIDQVIAATASWPGTPELEDSADLDDALAEVAAAMAAIDLVWRGREAAAPPPEPKPDLSPPSRNPVQEHQALLDRARPYQRVDHRPHDAELRNELAAAAEMVACIPPVVSALSFGLSATCSLAAAVSANATDDELAVLVQHDARRRPISAAVLLLAEGARVAGKRGRPVPQKKGEAALFELWNSIDWSEPGSWDAEDANVPSVLWTGSRITSPEAVKALLAQALEQQPQVLLLLVAACAQWVEDRAHEDWHLLKIRRRYREIPAWFPIHAVVNAAASTAPVTITVNEFGETLKDDPDSLLAQVLWLAEHTPT